MLFSSVSVVNNVIWWIMEFGGTTTFTVHAFTMFIVWVVSNTTKFSSSSFLTLNPMVVLLWISQLGQCKMSINLPLKSVPKHVYLHSKLGYNTASYKMCPFNYCWPGQQFVMTSSKTNITLYTVCVSKLCKQIKGWLGQQRLEGHLAERSCKHICMCIEHWYWIQLPIKLRGS